MPRNNYRRLCEARLRELSAVLERPAYRPGEQPAAGTLTLSSESGVKRLREFVGDGWGVRDLSPACLKWSEVYLVLEGAILGATAERENRARASGRALGAAMRRAGVGLEPAPLETEARA